MHIRTSFDPQLRRRRKFWGRGPWQREPDTCEFWHAGFRCFVGRARLGHLCGYVFVKKTHPWHSHTPDAYVHCGITFAGPVWTPVQRRGYAIGFDCAHWGDYIPETVAMLRLLGRRRLRTIDPRDGVYRTMQWVIRETQYLAEQAREASV